MRSQFIAPDLRQPLAVNQPVTRSGLAFAGNRGISKVEVSFDDDQAWQWRKSTARAPSSVGRPGATPGDRPLLAVCATDAMGKRQTPQGRGIGSEGATGDHRLTAKVTA